MFLAAQRGLGSPDPRCQKVKHLAVNIESAHLWINRKPEVFSSVRGFFSRLERISIVIGWPAWPPTIAQTDRRTAGDPAPLVPLTWPEYKDEAQRRHDALWTRTPYRLGYVEASGHARHTRASAARLFSLLHCEPRTMMALLPYVPPHGKGIDEWPISRSSCGREKTLPFWIHQVKLSFARLVRTNPPLKAEPVDSNPPIKTEPLD